MGDEDFQRLMTSVGALSTARLLALDALVRSRLAAAAAAAPAAKPSEPLPVEPPGCGPEPWAPVSDDAAAAISEAFPDDDRRDARRAGGIDGIEQGFAVAPCCPHCASNAIAKWGFAHGLRRYRCKACKVTFNALTATPLAHLRKRELWAGHAQALVDGVALRKVADRLDIQLSTAFNWRHRFLEAPRDLKAKRLEGTVEADETYFLYSEKGSREMTRPARKRGGKAAKRGLSAEQVPVLIARDRDAATTDQVLDNRSALSIGAVLEPVIAKDAVLVSDGAQAYRVVADKAGIAHVGLNLSAGERSRGIYHIQNVNAYCSRLKTWMRRFNGVATKYLDSYLGWHRINDREGNTLHANLMLTTARG